VPGQAVAVGPQQVTLGSYAGTVTCDPANTHTMVMTLTVPASGFLYVNLHLEYGLKHTGNYTPNSDGDALDCAKVKAGQLVELVPNLCVYRFLSALNGASEAYGWDAVQNVNTFKKNPGVGGLVRSAVSADPVIGATVTLRNPANQVIGLALSDEDGFYMINYKHTGRAVTYTVTARAGTWTQTIPVTLKANGYVHLDFDVP
jgi:hypothetical protein